MAEQTSILQRTSRFMAFATLGVVNLTQEMAGVVLASMEGADAELVAEETLCLVATATARAAEVGLRAHPEQARATLPVLLDVPFLYRDYLVGGAMIVQADASLLDANEAVYGRLQRKQAFYTAHFPANQFPGERALTDKMGLWMGRVSPPRLPEAPMDRLHRLACIPMMLTHLKLILAFARE